MKYDLSTLTDLADLPCQLHKMHTPVPTYSELHHIIPQEWQATWKPATFNWPQSPDDRALFPNAAKSPDHPGLVLWDARIVAACRTGHGNVHFWLVKLMHAYAAEPGLTLDQIVTKVVQHQHFNPQDIAISEQAIIRFEAAGGELATLWAAKQWGEI